MNHKNFNSMLRRLVTGISVSSLAIAFGSIGATTAHAQDGAHEPSAAEDGEIVVTAQKRSQRLSDVGLTISVLNSDQLQDSGVTDAADLARVTPGLTVGQAENGFKAFSIRGINFGANQMSAAPTVTAYIDEAPLPYAAMWGGLLLDPERVEVLKGPQGTLFGQNATGGSINVIAAKPTSELRAGGQFNLDEFGLVQMQGYVSGPLSDTLRARLAASTDQGGAWQKGFVSTTRENGKQDKLAGRLILEWTPSPDIKFTLNANGNRDKSQPTAYQLIKYDSTAFPAFATYPAPTNARQAETDLAIPNSADSYTWQLALRSEFDFAENTKLTSITNFVKTKFDTLRDIDGASIPGISTQTIGKSKTFTQELRVNGQVPTAGLTYIVGGYYQNDDLADLILTEFGGYAAAPPGTKLRSVYPETNRSWSLFGNADLEVAPGLTLTAGTRYTKTRQTLSGCLTAADSTIGTVFETRIANRQRASVGLPPVPAGVFGLGKCLTMNDAVATSDANFFLPIDPSRTLRQVEDNLSWRAGANYKVNSDTLLYALVSRGYKAGTFNVGALITESAFKPVKQEELTSYEVGVKAALLDRRLRINLSAFHYDYRNKQLLTTARNLFIGPQPKLDNIPKSTVNGFDADVTAFVTDDLSLQGAVTYADTRIGDYVGLSQTLVVTDFEGARYNFAPLWTATFGATWRPSLGSGLRAVVGGDGLYNSATNSDIAQLAELAIPAFTIFNARLGVESEAGWRAQIWVRNLTDKYYWTSTASPGEFSTRLPARPRTFGVSVGYDF